MTKYFDAAGNELTRKEAEGQIVRIVSSNKILDGHMYIPILTGKEFYVVGTLSDKKLEYTNVPSKWTQNFKPFVISFK